MFLARAVPFLLLLTASTTFAQPASGQLKVTILHNNDGESQLIDAGDGLEEFGGVARFAAVVAQLRAQVAADPEPHVSLLLSSGDNYLMGPELRASLDHGVPYFDTVAMDRMGYDAVCIGNHEFDLGPEVFADFVAGFSSPVPFLSANLVFAQEPRLAQLEQAGRLARSTVVEVQGERFGIVGATTADLPTISSPRDVQVLGDVTALIQAEIDALEAQGINRIIVVSHLQHLQSDVALVAQLRGVDVVIPGGGDELLANPGAVLIPGDETEIDGPYPTMAPRADGKLVPLVTTPGEYRYVGRLELTFDAAGEVAAISSVSGPVRVSSRAHADGVDPDADVEAQVVMPVQVALSDMASRVVATTEVELDGRRSKVRSSETNQGNLIADALRWTAAGQAQSFGTVRPDVAVVNGGGIRNNTIVALGTLSELDLFDMVPFPDMVTVVEGVDPAAFKDALERAFSAVQADGSGFAGRFGQASGFRVIYDSRLAEGSRVQELALDDGTVLVQEGQVVAGVRLLNVATIDFLARGGDGWNLGGSLTILGKTVQQAVAGYIQQPLGGRVTAAAYPLEGEARIVNSAVDQVEILLLDPALPDQGFFSSMGGTRLGDPLLWSGNETRFEVGGALRVRYGGFQLDLGALPPGAEIVAAQVSLLGSSEGRSNPGLGNWWLSLLPESVDLDWQQQTFQGVGRARGVLVGQALRDPQVGVGLFNLIGADRGSLGALNQRLGGSRRASFRLHGFAGIFGVEQFFAWEQPRLRLLYRTPAP